MSADSFFYEIRLRPTQGGLPVRSELQGYYKDVVQPVVSDSGLPRREKFILLNTRLEAGVPRDWAHQISVQCEAVAPGDTSEVVCR